MNDLHSLDHGNMYVLTLLDISATFDPTNHTLLLQRLERVFGMILLSMGSLLTSQTEFKL